MPRKNRNVIPKINAAGQKIGTATATATNVNFIKAVNLRDINSRIHTYLLSKNVVSVNYALNGLIGANGGTLDQCWADLTMVLSDGRSQVVRGEGADAFMAINHALENAVTMLPQWTQQRGGTTTTRIAAAG